MKKVLSLIILAVFVASLTIFLVACTRIDGARFTCTKAIFKAHCTAGKDTEDKEDNVYNVKFSITISVAVSQKDKVLSIEKSNFKFSQDAVSIVMTDLLGNAKETIEASGPKFESEQGTQIVTWVKFDLDFGSGISYSELSNLQSKLKLTYKGTNINLPKVISYS